MTTSDRQSPTTPAPPSLRGTLGWTVAVLLAVPLAVGVLWVVGAAAGGASGAAGRFTISWMQVGAGAAALLGLVLLVTGVHAARVWQYRRQLRQHRQAQYATLVTSGCPCPSHSAQDVTTTR